MAYKFQLGPAILSGSVTQEGDITGEGDLVLSNSGLIGCAADANLMTLANQSVAFANDVDVNIAKAGGLQIAGSAVTATAAELNYLDNSDLVAADLQKLADLTVTAAELNVLDQLAQGSILLGDGSGAAAITDIKTSGQILVGNGTTAVSVAVSGDATLAANGALTIAADSVEGTMLNTNAADGSTMELSSDSLSVLKVPNALTAGTGLSAAGTFDGAAARTVSVAAAQTSISSIYNTGLVVGYDAAGAHIDFSTDDQIQFDIDNAATLNISAQGLNVQQGGIQVPAEADIDVAGAGAASLYASVGANNLTLGGASSTVVIPGNLTVSGTTVEIDAAFIVTSSVQFEGITPDGNEISLTSADPTADRTITLPDLSGHIPLLAGAVSNANVTAAEFALLDGDSSPGTTAFADGHGIMHNAGGTMRQTTALKLVEYVLPKITGGDVVVSSGGAATIQADAVEASMLNDNCISGFDDIGAAVVATDELLISDDGTLKRTDMSRIATYVGDNLAQTVQTHNSDGALSSSAGLIVLAQSASTAYGLRLEPAAASEGKIFKIKRVDGQNVTIECDGSETIDGSSSIVLESQYAAVMVFSDGSNYHVI